MQLFKKSIVFKNERPNLQSVHHKNSIKMKQSKFVIFLAVIVVGFFGTAQEDEQYVTFNDRNNVVHGVYLGLTSRFGEVNNAETFTGGLKIAYVANQQFEVGFEGNFFYSDQNYFNTLNSQQEDLIGGYGGLHLEPIFFSKSRVNLSFPLLIGGGAIGQIGDDFKEEDFEEELTEEDFDGMFVLEPGVSALFNISRYVQLEVGVKYRFTSKFNLPNSPINRLNGFTAGLGIKLGVFNMGRNRYKKNIQDEE